MTHSASTAEMKSEFHHTTAPILTLLLSQPSTQMLQDLRQDIQQFPSSMSSPEIIQTPAESNIPSICFQTTAIIPTLTQQQDQSCITPSKQNPIQLPSSPRLLASRNPYSDQEIEGFLDDLEEAEFFNQHHLLHNNSDLPQMNFPAQKIPENECKIPKHKRQILSFVCRSPNCEQFLLCRSCKKSHPRSHQQSIESLDSWFNRMFGRRVEDNDNNKVSRRCGMQLGRLADDSIDFSSLIDTHIKQINEKSNQLISEITSYIQAKQSSLITKLESLKLTKSQGLQAHSESYKHLKSLNRFTILENLKRSHQLNANANPISSIVQFMIENESELADATQIELHHKSFSKLLRDIDDFETSMLKKKACIQGYQISNTIATCIDPIKSLIDVAFQKGQCVSSNDGGCCSEKSSKQQKEKIQMNSQYNHQGEESHDGEELEEEYVCEVQENFNQASFVGFRESKMRVLSNLKLFEYSLDFPFSKQDSLLQTAEIATANSNALTLSNSSSSSIFEIGAMDESYFSQEFPSIIIIGSKNDPSTLSSWNGSTQLCTYENAHACSITAITVTEVNKNHSIMFVAGSYDGQIKLWRLTNNNKSIDNQEESINSFVLIPERILRAHTDFVTALISIPENHLLLSAGADRKIALWDWKNTSEDIQSIFPTKIEHDIQEINENKSSENQKKKPKKFFRIQQDPSFFSSQSKTESVLQDKSTISQELHEQISTINPLRIISSAHSEKVNCLALLDDSYLASGSSDGTIKIWSQFLNVPQKLNNQQSQQQNESEQQRILNNTYVVNALVRLRKDVLVCSVNHIKMSCYRVNIWNWKSGTLITTINSHTGRITRVHAIPSGIVTCERNKVIRFWKNRNQKAAITSSSQSSSTTSNSTKLPISFSDTNSCIQNNSINKSTSTPKITSTPALNLHHEYPSLNLSSNTNLSATDAPAGSATSISNSFSPDKINFTTSLSQIDQMSWSSLPSSSPFNSPPRNSLSPVNRINNSNSSISSSSSNNIISMNICQILDQSDSGFASKKLFPSLNMTNSSPHSFTATTLSLQQGASFSHQYMTSSIPFNTNISSIHATNLDSNSHQNSENHPPPPPPSQQQPSPQILPIPMSMSSKTLLLGLRSLEERTIIHVQQDDSETRYSHSAPCSPILKPTISTTGSGGRGMLQKTKKASRNLFGV